MTWTQEEIDDQNEYDRDCGNCGGEGYIAMCEDEAACVDPESGCDMCMRRCDWCNQKPKAAQ